MPARKKNNQSLSEVIKGIISSNSKLASGLLRVKIISSWPQIVGKHIASKTLDVNFYGEKLYVKVSSSALRNELFFQKQRIITSIEEELDLKKGTIKELILK